MTQGLENSKLGILEFSVSSRGSKATEAISRNSNFRNSKLGILDLFVMRSTGHRGMTQGLGILDYL